MIARTLTPCSAFYNTEKQSAAARQFRVNVFLMLFAKRDRAVNGTLIKSVLPATLLPLILLRQIFRQWLKIFNDGAGICLTRASQFLQRVLPGL